MNALNPTAFLTALITLFYIHMMFYSYVLTLSRKRLGLQLYRSAIKLSHLEVILLSIVWPLKTYLVINGHLKFEKDK